MLPYEILRLIDKTKVEYLVLEDSLIKKLTEEYSEKVIKTLLGLLNKTKRWNIDGLEKEIVETDKTHVIEMIYITQKYFEIYPQLNSILNIEEIIIKIAIHDLGEVGVGDLAYNEQIALNPTQLEKHKIEESKYALRLIETLNRTELPKNKIQRIKDYYKEYEENKRNPESLNDYFIKFIDLYQAVMHIINHLGNLEDLEENPIFNDFQRLKIFNNKFKELGFDLLYNLNEVIDNKHFDKNDIKKLLYEN